MIRNYIIIAWRNLLRNKFISLINIGGLAVGMATFMIIAIYVSYELSYDQYFNNKDKIYRYVEQWFDSERLYTEVASGRKKYLTELAGIKNVARLNHFPSSTTLSGFISYYKKNDQNKYTFEEFGIYAAEQEFLDMFNFPFLFGDQKSVLKKEYTVVISKSTAIKYFGECSREIVGKTLFLNQLNPEIKESFTISGIFDDLPTNTHFNFDILLSRYTYSNNLSDYEDGVFAGWSHTYFTTPDVQDPSELIEKIQPRIDTAVANFFKNSNASGSTDDSFKVKASFQSLPNIYFSPSGSQIYAQHGNLANIKLLGGISLIILCIAWINYNNLSIVQIISRLKEAGIRKVIGATKKNIVSQFLWEALNSNLIAILISITLISIFLPFAVDYMNKPLNFTLWVNGSPSHFYFWILLFSIFIFGTCITGLYPSFVFSRSSPTKIFKSNFQKASGLPAYRKYVKSVFIFTQFLAVYILIGLTFGFYIQLNMLANAGLGFNKEKVLVLRTPMRKESEIEKVEFLKNSLLSNNAVIDVSSSSSVPGKTIPFGSKLRSLETDTIETVCQIITADEDFNKLYKLEIIAGRKFRKKEDINSILINDAALKDMGILQPDDIIGHQFNINPADRSDPYGNCNVVGVFKSYHHFSPKEVIEPLLIIQEGRGFTKLENGERVPGWSIGKKYDRSFLSIKLNGDNLQNSVHEINQLWKQVYPQYAFDYFFIDENYDTQYHSDLKFGGIFLVFTIISISLACLGFLGMTLFLINQRTKEIGIRKIMGASLTNLFGLMISRFMILILFAGLVGIPFTWYVLTRLLQEFAYRIDLSWWIFAAPLAFILFIALLTIGVNTLRKVNANPVDSLRYE